MIDQCQRCAVNESKDTPMCIVRFSSAGAVRQWHLCMRCAEQMREWVLSFMYENVGRDEDSPPTT